jgi:hypothetical protein
MFSKAAHRATAANEGRAAAQRQLAGSITITDRSGDPLDAYMQDLATWAKQTGYSTDSGKCLWCGKTARLKTGALPFVGPLLNWPVELAGSGATGEVTDWINFARAAGTAVNGFWRGADWVWCNDPGGPRWRPVESGSFPLAHRLAARMVRLRGYGNAIVAPVATEFIRAYLGVIE